LTGVVLPKNASSYKDQQILFFQQKMFLAAEERGARRVHQEKFLPCCVFRTRNFLLNAMTIAPDSK
jgi:hypothetical protein